MVAPLPELEARLFLNALESSFRNISFGVHNRNPARFDGMLELFVAPGLRNLEPAVLQELANDLSAVHRGASLPFKNTHSVYTHQWSKLVQEEKSMIKYEIAFPSGEPEA
jgi:hypothetical protein